MTHSEIARIAYELKGHQDHAAAARWFEKAAVAADEARFLDATSRRYRHEAGYALARAKAAAGEELN